MTREELYHIANQVGFMKYIKAAEEFERKECEKICISFARNERRVEVAAALNRAADIIRMRSELGNINIPETVTPKDFITYVD